jgi:hypothetical protein
MSELNLREKMFRIALGLSLILNAALIFILVMPSSRFTSNLIAPSSFLLRSRAEQNCTTVARAEQNCVAFQEPVSGIWTVHCKEDNGLNGETFLDLQSGNQMQRTWVSDMVRVVTPLGFICWKPLQRFSCELKPNATDLDVACLARESASCDLQKSTLNRMTQIASSADQLPIGKSLAVFITGSLRGWFAQKRLVKDWISAFKRGYGSDADSVFYFVSVYPASGWEGSSDEKLVREEILKQFSDAGVDSFHAHVIVNSDLARPCESVPGHTYCESSIGEPALSICGGMEVQFVRIQDLWNKVLHVETTRRQRFAYMARFRTDADVTAFPSFASLSVNLGLSGAAAGNAWPHANMDYSVYRHDQVWITTRDVADFFFSQIEPMRHVTYYENTWALMRVPAAVRPHAPHIPDFSSTQSAGFCGQPRKCFKMEGYCPFPEDTPKLAVLLHPLLVHTTSSESLGISGCLQHSSHGNFCF